MVHEASGPTARAVEAAALRVLVERATQRDTDAWEELYRRSYRNLYGFARRRLFDDRAAEDAVSETMARAIDHIDRFTWQGAGFDAWLYGIARNVVHELGRNARRTVTPTEDERLSVDGSPEEHAVVRDETTAMRRAFRRLEPEEQELLELRVQWGLSAEEVGQLLGKRAGAVRMAQARALRRLRTFFCEVQGAY